MVGFGTFDAQPAAAHRIGRSGARLSMQIAPERPWAIFVMF
jgi:hypothetical protein